MRPEVLGDLGGFGALVEIGKKYKNPVLDFLIRVWVDCRSVFYLKLEDSG